MSPAWRTLSLSARRVIDRIEIEMMNKGGDLKSNSRPRYEILIAVAIAGPCCGYVRRPHG
jgi:hypothetical protein